MRVFITGGTGHAGSRFIPELFAAGHDVTGVHLPAARLALAQLDELIAEGYGGKDCTLVAKLASPDGTLRGFDPASDAAASAAPVPTPA